MISTDIFSINGDKFSVQIDSNSTIYDLKMYLEMKYKISSKNINLIFQNKYLNDSMHLKSINFDQFPGIMIESIDISKPKILSDKDKKSIFSNLSRAVSNLTKIQKINQIQCNLFSLNYSFSKSVPVSFISLNAELNKNAILNSITMISEVFNIMNFDHSQFNLYTIRRVLYDNVRLSDVGIFRQCSFRASQNIKQKFEKLKELKICNENDHPFSVPATANMFVSELKQYIAYNNCKANKENIILLYGNILLDDEKQISYYKIPNKATISYSILRQENFVVALKFSDSTSINLPYKNKNAKFIEFRKIVEKTFSIPDNQFYLFYNNILIEKDGKLFSDLTKKSQIEIEFRKKTDLFYLIKSNEDKDIFFKIDFNKNDTIYNIKRTISDLFDVLIGDQVLFYKDLELYDDLLISECGVEFGSVLELNLIPIPKFFPISIPYKNQILEFTTIHQNMYVRDLKQLIKEKTGDSINDIEITIQPRKLEDNDMLSDLYIKNGLSLFLCPKFTPLNVKIVTVMNDNFDVLVYPEMTIKIFKQILDCLLGKTNQQLSVFFNGKQVQDEYTFQYIGVTESSTLFVLLQ